MKPKKQKTKSFVKTKKTKKTKSFVKSKKQKKTKSFVKNKKKQNFLLFRRPTRHLLMESGRRTAEGQNFLFFCSKTKKQKNKHFCKKTGDFLFY